MNDVDAHPQGWIKCFNINPENLDSKTIDDIEAASGDFEVLSLCV
jgi:hypothetical protein